MMRLRSSRSLRPRGLTCPPVPSDDNAAVPGVQTADIRLDSPCNGWTYAPAPATRYVECDALTGRAWRQGSVLSIREEFADPLQALAYMEASVKEPWADGRWIGYLSYDLGRLFESIPSV